MLSYSDTKDRTTNIMLGDMDLFPIFKKHLGYISLLVFSEGKSNQGGDDKVLKQISVD